ncbi:MAG: dihydroorotase [Saprospiraceae bacterium]|jgi:dihydroorotase
MNQLTIKDGWVIDPKNGINQQQNIYISDGIIVATGKTAPANFKALHEIDASNKIVCPGLIDLCARVRVPGADSAQALETELQSALAGGITRLVCPPDTRPVIDLAATALLEQDLANDFNLTRVHPLGAMTRGLSGEVLTDMAMLKEAGCVGVSNGLKPITDTLVARRAMQYASTYDIKVFLTPIDAYLQGNGCIHEGEISTLLGLPAIPESAETVAVARDLALVETANVEAHIHLISSGRSVNMIRNALKRGLSVSASVAAHHLHLSEEDMVAFDSSYKVQPPLRSLKDKQSLREGVKDGTLKVICSDHQSRGKDTKLVPFSEASTGMVGFQTLLPLVLQLAEEKVCKLDHAIALVTSNPAEQIGIDAGHLSIGAAADLCIFNANETWEVSSDSLLSRGKNTPFNGKQMRGKVQQTLINGKVVFQA